MPETNSCHKMNIPYLPKETPLAKARRLVSDHNDRCVSWVYGDSALSLVRRSFGEQSSEAEAYAAYLAKGRELHAALSALPLNHPDRPAAYAANEFHWGCAS